ncbi:MAG: restriction endonuclease subunit S [Bacteroidota bacterium]
MQQLFSAKWEEKDGQRNFIPPTLRFKQADGSDFSDWEEKMAKKVFFSHSNKNHNGDLPILSSSQKYGMIYREDSGIQIQSSEKSVKSYKIVEPGDFVISLRSFQGGIDYSSFRGICSPAYTILKNKEPINDSFYRIYFKKERFIERLSKTTVGIRDGKQITFEAFGGLKIPYPCIEEQKRIAQFLCTIEKDIEITSLSINSFTKFKKGLLQKMFV